MRYFLPIRYVFTGVKASKPHYIYQRKLNISLILKEAFFSPLKYGYFLPTQVSFHAAIWYLRRMTQSARSLLRLNSVTLMRGARILLRDFSFSIARGEVVQLTGANGAGKTSLLRLMAGVLAPESGNLEKDETVSHIYIPPDDRALKTQETVLENLQFWGGETAAAMQQVRLLDLANLAVRKLSAGQKRRLSLARLFLKPHGLWLLDEPLNALDADAAALLQRHIRDHAAVGGAVIVAGHQRIDGAREVAIA